MLLLVCAGVVKVLVVEVVNPVGFEEAELAALVVRLSVVVVNSVVAELVSVVVSVVVVVVGSITSLKYQFNELISSNILS